MPTYEYACAACGHKFEEFQSITAPAVKKCPVCKKNKVQRLISTGGGFIFKGSGFYITDYRSDAYKNAAKSDTAPAAAKSETGGKTESGKADPAKTDSTSSPAKTESAPAKVESSTTKPAESKSTKNSGEGAKKTAAA